MRNTHRTGGFIIPITSVYLVQEAVDDVERFKKHFGHKNQSETIRYIIYKGRQAIRKEEGL